VSLITVVPPKDAPQSMRSGGK